MWVAANDRAGLKRLCRYGLRPPFAQERLRLRSDGGVALELKTAWHDGTRELGFESLEFLERLMVCQQEPGGWNRIILQVKDLPARVEAIKKDGLHFRNEMEVGPGGKQIQIEDPDGNPIELFEPAG